MEKCKVLDCNNHVMDGNFGLESHRYGYCQIHKIEGTIVEVSSKDKNENT